jgi:hypothetical protein
VGLCSAEKVATARIQVTALLSALPDTFFKHGFVRPMLVVFLLTMAVAGVPSASDPPVLVLRKLVTKWASNLVHDKKLTSITLLVTPAHLHSVDLWLGRSSRKISGSQNKSWSS